MFGWQKLIHHDNERRRLSCVDREELMWCGCWSVNWPVNRPFTFCWTAQTAAVTIVYYEICQWMGSRIVYLLIDWAIVGRLNDWDKERDDKSHLSMREFYRDLRMSNSRIFKSSIIMILLIVFSRLVGL